ncbi:MAG: DUF4349 domain-containing protein [bacterium]|nr:DUF4349 domain-containing protein [bacterium]
MTSFASRARRAAATAALAALALTGCGSGNSPDPGRGSQGEQSVTDAGGGAPPAAPEAGGGAPAQGGDSGSSAVAPSVITTGEAAIRTDDPAAAAVAFTDAAIELGGTVSRSETSSSGDSPRAEVTVRIPADEYQTLVDRLGEFGEVEHQSSTSEDVGQEVADLQARRDALQASIDRLTELMASSETTADLLEAEAMITQRQAELDSLTAQLTYLQDQVAMSTLTVEFATDAVASSYTSPSVWERAWRFFTDSLEGIVLFVAGILPWAVVLGAVAWVVLAITRRRRPGPATPGFPLRERAPKSKGSSPITKADAPEVPRGGDESK